MLELLNALLRELLALQNAVVDDDAIEAAKGFDGDLGQLGGNLGADAVSYHCFLSGLLSRQLDKFLHIQ